MLSFSLGNHEAVPCRLTPLSYELWKGLRCATGSWMATFGRWLPLAPNSHTAIRDIYCMYFIVPRSRMASKVSVMLPGGLRGANKVSRVFSSFSRDCKY